MPISEPVFVAGELDELIGLVRRPEAFGEGEEGEQMLGGHPIDVLQWTVQDHRIQAPQGCKDHSPICDTMLKSPL